MKKWKGKTRWLAVLLSLCVAAAVMPMTAFAGVTDTGDGQTIGKTTTYY